MSVDRVTSEPPAELPTEPGDRDLELLLADVRRIADGADAVRELVITLTGPRAPSRAPVNTDAVLNAWFGLSTAYARGVSGGSNHANVSLQELLTVLDALAPSLVRS